jgi:hypothetical protein
MSPYRPTLFDNYLYYPIANTDGKVSKEKFKECVKIIYSESSKENNIIYVHDLEGIEYTLLVAAAFLGLVNKKAFIQSLFWVLANQPTFDVDRSLITTEILEVFGELREELLGIPFVIPEYVVPGRPISDIQNIELEVRAGAVAVAELKSDGIVFGSQALSKETVKKFKENEVLYLICEGAFEEKELLRAAEIKTAMFVEKDFCNKTTDKTLKSICKFIRELGDTGNLYVAGTLFLKVYISIAYELFKKNSQLDKAISKAEELFGNTAVTPDVLDAVMRSLAL